MQRLHPAPDDPQKPAQPYSAPAVSTAHADNVEDGGARHQVQSARSRIPLNRYATFGIIAAAGAAADLITKQQIFAWRGLPNSQPPWWLVENVLGIETAVNIGAVFGIGAGRGTMFAALSVFAGAGILVWLFWYGAARSWWLLTALSMVCGGIVGNLYDRLGLWWEPGMPEEWKSGVRDWILMQAGSAYKWPNYNIADSLLVIGAIMLVWRSFFPSPEDLPNDQPASK